MSLCNKCSGTGRFITYGGRDYGSCFRCKGTGQLNAEPVAAKPVGIVVDETTRIVPDHSHLPNTARLIEENNLRLYLSECKVIKTQAGRLLVVGPVFGEKAYGSLSPDGTLTRWKGLTDAMYSELQAIEAEGIDAAKRIGKLTGVCCVCGRTLTNEGSIEEGIGPICASKFG